MRSWQLPFVTTFQGEKGDTGVKGRVGYPGQTVRRISLFSSKLFYPSLKENVSSFVYNFFWSYVSSSVIVLLSVH